jgi:flavorubredoxin
MKQELKIADDIYYVGAQDWDRRLFDEVVPLPEGTSYNSYLIIGSEKTALIDTVDPPKGQVLLDNLEGLGISKIDYIISNHAEQDHSGFLNEMLVKFPGAKIVTNAKCKDFLKDLLLTDESKFITVNDREILSLGNKTLEFILFPWVHWPETMVTYLKEDKILFSCDFFGAHLAQSGVFADDESSLYMSAKRYYSEIMMPFRNIIKKNFHIIESLAIKMIAPSHGPVYDDPGFIINAYRDWISDDVKNEVVIPYISMHGSTAKMVDHVVQELFKNGIPVKPFNLAVTDIGHLAMGLVDAATVIIAAPTFLAGAHPAMVSAVYLFNAIKPKTRFAGIIGSYGWGSKAVEQIKSMITYKELELFEPVYIKGHPKKDDYALLDKLVKSIISKHKENNLL